MYASVCIRLCLLLAASLLLDGCQPRDMPPLDQQLYVWQRQWKAAHSEALAQTREDFSTLRVLALQAFPQAGWNRARIDAALLKRDGRALIAVIRLDGQLKTLDRTEVIAQIQQVLADWQGQGLILAGVEIDHDAGSARLSDYRAFLGQLRMELPESLRLSITALPSWLGSPELPALLATVDSSVLQVHAVSDPKRGLFDARQARDWAERWGDISPQPFYLALPAYGVALLPGDGGAPIVEGEVPLERMGQRRELMADPLSLSRLASQLRHDPPKHLAGLIWFRLPLKGDRRAWSLETLRAVARGEALSSRLQLTLAQENGLFDIGVSNQGNLDGALPGQLVLAATKCDSVDALAGYSVRQLPGQLVFTRHTEGRLQAGSARAVGWARCSRIDQGGSHVRP